MRKTLAKCGWKHFQTNSYLQYDADGCKVSETNTITAGKKILIINRGFACQQCICLHLARVLWERKLFRQMLTHFPSHQGTWRHSQLHQDHLKLQRVPRLSCFPLAVSSLFPACFLETTQLQGKAFTYKHSLYPLLRDFLIILSVKLPLAIVI